MFEEVEVLHVTALYAAQQSTYSQSKEVAGGEVANFFNLQ
jgi:hypothetical protein